MVRRIIVLDIIPLLLCAMLFWVGNDRTAPATMQAAVAAFIPASWMEGDKEEAPDSATVAMAKITRRLAPRVLVKTDPDTLPFIEFTPDMLQAMLEQASYLRRDDMKHKVASGVSREEMLRTVERLEKIQLLDPKVLLEKFDFYKVRTSLKSDQVRVTGYYTPLVKGSRTRGGEYQYPMLRKPKSGVPSPAAIDAGALEGQDLEMCWLKSEKELQNAQLQGSCMVDFADGKRKHYGFGGSVRGRGGAYVFFQEMDEDKVIGAGFFPLTAGYSVAVDPRFIPIGSTLLAELPNISPSGQHLGYTYRIIFAQDRGGAILTTKRIDLYCGLGQKGLQEARKVNRLGRLWLMLPK
ncbi:MAG TPA: MltA domain-containing protein [Saprospiraceae bacterium]|nr:MltA domain-containing protein [Saprospiraceae bacterium]HND88009.1 MltA domain-containing protein [Saprospiraceae bacterium]